MLRFYATPYREWSLIPNIFFQIKNTTISVKKISKNIEILVGLNIVKKHNNVQNICENSFFSMHKLLYYYIKIGF